MSVFERNTWCLLGVPIDVIGYRQAIDRVWSSVETGQRCFFSTPNLNFIITASSDRAFLESVICSDLVLLDGMPPVWIARLLGIPGIEKISGSNLFETLWQEPPAGGRKIRVFLFGGEDGIAATACERINRLARGIECVGHYYPGFDTVEAMSSKQIMERMNATDADFVVVALGAKKGQAWIMANLDKLRAPVVSHLGAVVNFAAGNIARAPGWMQTLGLEWVWRICQEPTLWKRYFFDGLRLVELLVFKVMPYVLWRRLHSRRLKGTYPVEYSIAEDEQSATIYLHGDCLQGTISPLRTLFEREASKCRPLTLDLAGVDLIDGAFLGLCLSLYILALEHDFDLRFINPGPAQRRIFKWNSAEYLL